MAVKVLLLLLVTGVVIGKRYNGYQLLEARPQNAEQMAYIMSLGQNKLFEINMWTDPIALGPVSFSLPAVSNMMVKQLLAEQQIPFVVAINDLQTHIDNVDAARNVARLSAEDDPATYILSDYQRHETVNAWLDAIAANYSIATVRTIGRSYEGREMKAITISSGTGRNSSVLDCGIHAREWITVSTCIYTINRLLTQYGSDPIVTGMVDTYDWHILPIVNPDGYAYTFENDSGGEEWGDRLWRKTRSPNNEDAECPGTDANRNFDIYWGEAGVIDDPCADNYHGSAPFSEVETQGVRDWLAGIQNKKFYLNIHSFTQLWLVPWGYHPVNQYPEDYAELVRVANLAMASLYAVHQREFEVGTPGDILYEVSGGALDWAKQNGFKYSYSPELRPEDPFEGGFILPPTDIIPAGEEVFAALITHYQEMQ